MESGDAKEEDPGDPAQVNRMGADVGSIEDGDRIDHVGDEVEGQAGHQELEEARLGGAAQDGAQADHQQEQVLPPDRTVDT